MWMRFGVGVLVLLALSLGRVSSAITVSDLRCEYQAHPLGVDTPQPRLSWVLHSQIRGDRPTGFRLLVAGSQKNLDRNVGDLWDTRMSPGLSSLQAIYAGKPLKSGQTCYWKVCARDRQGKVGPWSRTARWEMGYLSPSDWKAKWINDGKSNPAHDADFYQEDPAPLFRTEFTPEKAVRKARLAISGIGYYAARLNGAPIGDHVLAPAWTRYDKRVYYTIYDVTQQIHAGANCLGVTLGNGWYNPLPMRMFGQYNLRDYLPVGRPRFIAQLELEFADGTRQTVVSDASWKVADGPLRFNNIYLGEVYDARKELMGWDRPGFDDSGWRRPALATEPLGPLQAQEQPPIRITQRFVPIALTEPAPGVHIFDMGQNFAGWVQIKLSAPAGTKIVLRYGELLHKDGTLNPMTSVAGQIKGAHRTANGTMESLGGPGAPNVAWQSDTYIAGGKGVETYTPQFTFHGFRYVELTGYPGNPTKAMLVGLRLNADVERVGFFHCSQPLLNRIQQMCDATFRSNLFSVQSDCPHRERFGYGGDLAATCDTFLMNYDMQLFYEKAVRDFQDSAMPDGLFTDTAPYVGIQYCGVAWAMAHPLVAQQLYHYYGDTRLAEEQYPAAKRWIDRVTARYPGHIVTEGLSDHESLAPVSVPGLVTPLYGQSADVLSELAELTESQGGNAETARKESEGYRALADSIRSAYRAQFVDATTGKVGNGTQASQAFALELNMVPQQLRPLVLKRLVAQIEGADHDHLTTGIFGANFLLDVLSQEGYGDLAYKIVTQQSFPGWGYMLANGATTLWEHWEGSDNTFSQNHPMFGSVSRWLLQWVGGIRTMPGSIGFDRIEIQPLILGDLQECSCRYRSARGDIVCDWHRRGDSILLEVKVPVEATAHVHLPNVSRTQVTESGAPLKQMPGVLTFDPANRLFDCTLGSGTYRFEIHSPTSP